MQVTPTITTGQIAPGGPVHEIVEMIAPRGLFDPQRVRCRCGMTGLFWHHSEGREVDCETCKRASEFWRKALEPGRGLSPDGTRRRQQHDGTNREGTG